MRKYSNPLDTVRVASPCPADWDQMYGNERKRFCGDCKLNVYNLSAMTRTEAESFLLNSEGRVCVKFYRRRDGTVITQDCPVGLERFKRRISRVAAAVFAVIAGFVSGIGTLETLRSIRALTNYEKVPEPFFPEPSFGVYGALINLSETQDRLKRDDRNRSNIRRNKGKQEMLEVGRVENVRSLKDEPVVAWIE